ncbi:MAG: hypothetical protein EAX96_13525 [Candidatus Lokiarchaeota archaeon]|nr:hypothetical protein [Candidatus Lokiarchaeota archaeon]
MIKNVLIFLTNGNLLVSRSYGFQEKDMLILTGLLSAFENLTDDLGEGEIKNIIMHQHQILMEIEGDICFALFIDQEDDPRQGKLILDTMIDTFFTIYKGSPLILPGRLVEVNDFNPFLKVLDELVILKNVYAILESSPKKLNIREILDIYSRDYNPQISEYEIWNATKTLVQKEIIVKSDEEDAITFRKKGEILKKFKFKLKD